MIIRDPEFNRGAGVDENNRLKVVGQTDSAEVTASIDGRAFFVNSGIINLTSDTKSAIIYIKNTSDRNLVLVKTTFHLSTSTGGTGNTNYYVAVNPAGTITSGGSTIVPFNVNLSKLLSDPFEGTAFKGATGLTAVSSFGEVEGILTQPGLYQIDSSITLPKGASISTLLQAPAGNTSMDVVIDYLCYYE